MNNDELMHYGVLGMKWGHRKAQPVSVGRQRLNNAKAAYKNSEEGKAARQKKIKTAAKVGAAVAATALAVYGGYKLNKYVKSENGQKNIKRAKERIEEMQSDHHVKSYERRADRSAKRMEKVLGPEYANSGVRIVSKKAVNEAIKDQRRHDRRMKYYGARDTVQRARDTAQRAATDAYYDTRHAVRTASNNARQASMERHVNRSTKRIEKAFGSEYANSGIRIVSKRAMKEAMKNKKRR